MLFVPSEVLAGLGSGNASGDPPAHEQHLQVLGHPRTRRSACQISPTKRIAWHRVVRRVVWILSQSLNPRRHALFNLLRLGERRDCGGCAASVKHIQLLRQLREHSDSCHVRQKQRSSEASITEADLHGSSRPECYVRRKAYHPPL